MQVNDFLYALPIFSRVSQSHSLRIVSVMLSLYNLIIVSVLLPTTHENQNQTLMSLYVSI